MDQLVGMLCHLWRRHKDQNQVSTICIQTILHFFLSYTSLNRYWGFLQNWNRCKSIQCKSVSNQVKYFLIPFKGKCGCHTWTTHHGINSTCIRDSQSKNTQSRTNTTSILSLEYNIHYLWKCTVTTTTTVSHTWLSYNTLIGTNIIITTFNISIFLDTMDNVNVKICFVSFVRSYLCSWSRPYFNLKAASGENEASYFVSSLLIKSSLGLVDANMNHVTPCFPLWCGSRQMTVAFSAVTRRRKPTWNVMLAISWTMPM